MAAKDRNNFTYAAQAMRTQKIPRNRGGNSVAISARLYYLRAYDTGTAGYVYWGPFTDSTSGLNPSSSQTTPNYTGTLQNQHVWLIRSA